MNKILLFILIVLVLIGGGYFILNPSKRMEPTPSGSAVVNKMPANDEDVDEMVVEDTAVTEETGNVITYTDEGYSPKTLTVKVGDTVTFNNESSLNMWVASAQHPTHQAYPGFDQLEATGAGTSYEFMFDNVGEWEYHNHVRPNHIGTIIVEE